MFRNQTQNRELAAVCARYGIVLPTVRDFVPDGARHNAQIAEDAQPGLITTANNGIPAYLTNLIDPEVIRVLTTPNAAAEIYGESQKGSWTDATMTFVMVEATGEVSSYGDFDNNGSTGVNTNFPQRQSYFYQTISEYGDRNVEMAGLAKINYVSEVDVAAAMVLDKFQNNSYFFGIAGLQNYGALNDPALPASIQPVSKAGGGYTWATATADEIYADIVKLFQDVAVRAKGYADRKAAMTLALSPGREAYMTKTNQYGINVSDLIQKNFPNLVVKTATQYTTDSGELMQLRLNAVDGRPTSFCAFPEKLRSHGFVRGHSSTSQKKSQGTWGCVIRYPFAFGAMLGI